MGSALGGASWHVSCSLYIVATISGEPTARKSGERMRSVAILGRTGQILIFDARMALPVPETVMVPETGEPFPGLIAVVDSLLDFIGAAAGWIGLRDAKGRLTFPVRRGEFSESWLRSQQSGVWGFAVREGPSLLNDLRPWTALGERPLYNLLCCPLIEGDAIVGHVALANKPRGFVSQDSIALQGMAHHLARLLDRAPPRPTPPAAWRRVLDRAVEGILLFDEFETLLFANAAWLDWTGFRAEDLLGLAAPFPFWVGQHDLARAANMADAIPTGAVPFRRRDRALFWCQVETVMEAWEGRSITMAFLRRASAKPLVAERIADPPPVRGELPFGVALTDQRGRLLWSNPALARLTLGTVSLGQPLRAGLRPDSAAILDRLLGEWGDAEPGRMGNLVLQTGDDPLILYWLTVPLREGVGFFFALTGEPEGFSLATTLGLESSSSLDSPTPDWLPLLLEIDGGIDGWGPRWEKLTGLPVADVMGSRSELVLDWLFPQQSDRERVADCIHQANPGGCQLLLDVATPSGGRPSLCTFLPLPMVETTGKRRRWLLLVGESQV